MAIDLSGFTPETVRISELKQHPRNYRQHPDDQLDHLIQSISEHGLYRNVVIARDGTILAGHGVVQALAKMGRETIPVIRLDIDPDSPAALKVLTGDNEVGHLAEVDDRMFTEILKEIRDTDVAGLLGTGYDDMMLANLLFITRPESEIKAIDEAAEWVGMPAYEGSLDPLKIIINCRSESDKQDFFRTLGIKATEKTKCIWWPPKERDDVSSIRFGTRKIV
jgi:hypothetical protein